MNIFEIAMSLKNVVMTYPFDEKTRVYKVENKMFLLTDEMQSYISVKNNPDKNYMLRSSYDYVKSGYHLNKEHWITVDLTGDYDHELVAALIVESYQIVVSKLPKKLKIHYLEELC